jgi:hypothetical protein
MSKIMKKPKECVCRETLLFWEEDRNTKYGQTPTWIEIEFKANELYPYAKKIVKNANYTIYRLYTRDEEGLILLDSYTVSADTFNKHFMDIGKFREFRIKKIKTFDCSKSEF